MSKLHLQTIMKPKKGSGQSVAYTGTAGTITNAAAQGITVLKVRTTTDSYVSVDGTATTADHYCGANTDYYFPISPGAKASAVQVTTGGTMYTSEMTQ